MNAILATCTAVTILSVLTCRVPTTANAWTDTSARPMEMSINLIQGAVRIFFFIFTGSHLNGEGIVFSRVCLSISSHSVQRRMVIIQGSTSNNPPQPTPCRNHPWETFKLVLLGLWGVLLRTDSRLKKPMK